LIFIGFVNILLLIAKKGVYGMKQRSEDDRRIKKVKVAVDKRKKMRRKDDVDNAKAYYLVVGFMGSLLFMVGISSYILSVK
tara:strand:- start:8836 stop:9078 length:243 start_codon:yes stop_codon:yes gene_type:complete